jgi:hypothetical protein
VPRSDLPREVSRRPLSFTELIRTLRHLDGSTVILSFAPFLGGGRGPTLSVVGSIRPAPSVGDGEIHQFWIGEPENLNGGHLRLTESSFRTAPLTTLDGNDYFIVHIRLDAAEIQIQDEASGAPYRMEQPALSNTAA